MTDPLQFDIVQSAPGWWGANAFNQLKRREFITLVNMSQIQVGSEERRFGPMGHLRGSWIPVGEGQMSFGVSLRAA
jgi:hypothetical protein